jgi:hypothetical protein
MTLAYAWIIGAFAGFLFGWLLVPAALPVEYLTPIVTVGPFLGLMVGGILVRVRSASLAQ